MSSSTPGKKRKQPAHAESAPGPSSKKSRKVRRDGSERRDKNGKLHRSVPDGEFKMVKASLIVSIPPIFANNPMSGVEEMLDSLTMRYVPELEGVVLCYSNTQFLSSTAKIKGDCPYSNCTVGFDVTIWSPQVGMKMISKVNLYSPDHISLLVHRTFNVSIPRHHIQTDHWEFEYGPAENDPEFGYGALDAQESDGQPTLDAVNDEGNVNGVDGGGGKWIHNITGERLGGVNGWLEFTVVGLTIANQMLSLVGSLQLDPFSKQHVARPAVLSSTKSVTAREPSRYNDADLGDDIAFERDDADGDGEEDTFVALGRLGEEAIAREDARKAQADADSKTEKKRKKENVPSAEKNGKSEKKAKKKNKSSHND